MRLNDSVAEGLKISCEFYYLNIHEKILSCKCICANKPYPLSISALFIKSKSMRTNCRRFQVTLSKILSLTFINDLFPEATISFRLWIIHFVTKRGQLAFWRKLVSRTFKCPNDPFLSFRATTLDCLVVRRIKTGILRIKIKIYVWTDSFRVTQVREDNFINLIRKGSTWIHFLFDKHFRVTCHFQKSFI